MRFKRTSTPSTRDLLASSPRSLLLLCRPSRGNRRCRNLLLLHDLFRRRPPSSYRLLAVYFPYSLLFLLRLTLTVAQPFSSARYRPSILPRSIPYHHHHHHHLVGLPTHQATTHHSNRMKPVAGINQ